MAVMSTTRTHPGPTSPAAAPAPPAHSPAAGRIWALTRVSLGLGYLWTFLDLTFGLGMGTPAERAWLTGNSPIRWSLINLDGPVAELVHPTSGQPAVDLALMVFLFATGVALLLGVALWPAAALNAVVMGLTAAVRWPEPSDTFIDAHLIFLLLGVGLAAARAGDVWGLGPVWRRSPLVRRLPWLR
ncbi:hypothetical protein [Actinorugispora endophytica]|uniref:Thiosulfate dehydrogenase [quinone] large subunit n=1 Tax=Actinorugispora endophytica TaxID=1605990 RepID=A0A4R6UW21_9ACTN|nr:hypothetical protein [Actinorugispora endophytica]TDQ51441.1 thiosulfate dehydrogenase [quinone] large subunit [Actinorugispora endophytica]